MEILIETNTLYEIFKKMKPFCAKDDRMPILQGICCEVQGNRMKCAALDGYIFIETIVPISNTSGEDGQFVLPIVDGFKKTKNPSDQTSISVGELDIALTNESGSRTVKKFQGDYPAYSHLRPQTSAESVIYMNATRLATALSSFFKGEAVEIQYRGELSPVLIRGREACTLVCPVRPSKKETEKEYYNGMAGY